MRLDPERVSPTPWPNGAGLTRELASEHDGSALSWRVSVADLEATAEFSHLPGLDRVFLPVGPVHLTVDGEEHDLVAGQALRFPGEAHVQVELVQPTRAVNVMTGRGRVEADALLRATSSPAHPAAAAIVELGPVSADVLLVHLPPRPEGDHP